MFNPISFLSNNQAASTEHMDKIKHLFEAFKLKHMQLVNETNLDTLKRKYKRHKSINK